MYLDSKIVTAAMHGCNYNILLCRLKYDNFDHVRKKIWTVAIYIGYIEYDF